LILVKPAQADESKHSKSTEYLMSAQSPQSRQHGGQDAAHSNIQSRPQPVTATRKVRRLGSTAAPAATRPATPRARKKIRRLDPVPGPTAAAAAATSARLQPVAAEEIRRPDVVPDDPNRARTGPRRKQHVAYVVAGTTGITSPQWWFVCPRCRGTGQGDSPGIACDLCEGSGFEIAHEAAPPVKENHDHDQNGDHQHEQS
jgi:hypothetical protein